MDVTLKTDHLPLKKFLQKNPLDSNINNWAGEISSFNIKFECLKGIKNTVVDTMSCLIKLDPQIQLEPEESSYEFSYYTFDL